MKQKKADALNAYKAARKAVLENRTEETWKTFCEAKRVCMLLGVRI